MYDIMNGDAHVSMIQESGGQINGEKSGFFGHYPSLTNARHQIRH